MEIKSEHIPFGGFARNGKPSKFIVFSNNAVFVLIPLYLPLFKGENTVKEIKSQHTYRLEEGESKFLPLARGG